VVAMKGEEEEGAEEGVEEKEEAEEADVDDEEVADEGDSDVAKAEEDRGVEEAVDAGGPEGS